MVDLHARRVLEQLDPTWTELGYAGRFDAIGEPMFYLGRWDGHSDENQSTVAVRYRRERQQRYLMIHRRQMMPRRSWLSTLNGSMPQRPHWHRACRPTFPRARTL